MKQLFYLRKWGVLFSLIFILLSFQLKGSETGSAVLSGTIKDINDKPISNVVIEIPQLSRVAISGDDGGYSIKNLPSGTYHLTFSMLGYQNENRKIRLEKGEEKIVNITLKYKGINMDAVTITGSATASNPFTTPADIEVLSGREKFVKQSASLGKTLENISGVSTISTGSQMGKPVIRGLSGNRIRILQDGSPTDFQQFGVRHGPNVDPFSVKKIEVVRGAASVQYGSDALGGAVNVIPNSVPNAIGSKGFLEGKLLGSFSTNNDELTGGLNISGAVGGFGIDGTITRRTAGNIYTPDVSTFQESGVDTDPKFTGELPYTDFDQLNGSLGMAYQGKFGKIVGRYDRWKNEHNFLLPNGKGLGQNLENNSYVLKGVFPLGNNLILKPHFNYSRNLRQSNPGGGNAISRSGLPDNGPAHLNLILDSYNSRVEVEHPKVLNFSGTIGVQHLYQEQISNGPGELLVPSGKVQNIGAYVFEKTEFGDFRLSIGARIDHRDQTATAAEQLNLPNFAEGESEDVLDQNYTVFSATVGGNYSITDHLTVAANASRGFRAPNFFDLHVDGVHGGVAAYQIGDPSLLPEKSLNTDFSVRYQSDIINGKITGYRNAIDNYIFLINTGEVEGETPILRTVQGNAELYGLDARLTIQLSKNFKIKGSFEVVNGRNVDEDITSVDELPLLPPNRLRADVTYQLPQLSFFNDLSISLGVNHAFAKEAAGRYEPFWQFGPAFPFGRASTDAYTLLNAGIEFDIDVKNNPISFALKADNLLNTAYRDFLDTYKGYALSPGRDISFRVKVPFELIQRK